MSQNREEAPQEKKFKAKDDAEGMYRKQEGHALSRPIAEQIPTPPVAPEVAAPKPEEVITSRKALERGDSHHPTVSAHTSSPVSAPTPPVKRQVEAPKPEEVETSRAALQRGNSNRRSFSGEGVLARKPIQSRDRGRSLS